MPEPPKDGDTQVESGRVQGEQADDDGPSSGPLRMCAVSRVERPIAELIRFVAGPDGVVVPDLSCRLPGRGVWVAGSKSQVAEAVRRNVFSKSLKKAVNAPADLADRIEVMILKRVIQALALANKAALVVPGFAQVDEALVSGNIVALLHGSDGAIGGREKLDRKFEAIAKVHNVQPKIIDQLTIDQMSLAIGRSNVVHAALISGGATARLLDEFERLARFRTLPDAS